MFTLIKNANLYAPAYLGKTDILLCGEKIAHISKTIELNESFCHTIDVQGKIVTPGFIDQHVHITGGGGQQGYASLVLMDLPKNLLRFMPRPKLLTMTDCRLIC